MKPDWLPDWRDPSAYPNVENTDMHQWGWEFLRRNPEYQQDIKTIEDLPEQILLKLRKKAVVVGVRGLEPEGLACLPDCPQLLENLKHRLAIGEKYGLGRTIEPPNPAIADFPTYIKLILWSLDLPKFSWIEWMREDPDCSGGLKPETINEVVVKFDLNQPLSYQIECVRITLATHQQKLETEFGKRRRELLHFYLRLSDAEASGAHLNELASVLLPHTPANYECDFGAQKRLRANLKAAHHLINGGYLTLLKNTFLKK